MEFEELMRLLERYEILFSENVEYEYDKYIEERKNKIENELIDIVKSYFPDVRIQFIGKIIENCIEQPLKSVSYGRKDIVALDEQLQYAVGDLIKSVENSKSVNVIDSELESDLRQITDSFSLSQLSSCPSEFKEEIRRYFMYRYESSYMSSKQIEISLENMLHDLEKKVVANISSIETDMKDIIDKQYLSFRTMAIERVKEFRKNDVTLESNEKLEESQSENVLESNSNVSSSLSLLNEYAEILEIANNEIINCDGKILIRNKSTGLERELISMDDLFISTDFEVEIATSKDGKKSYSDIFHGISIVIDNSRITISDTNAAKEIVVEDSLVGKKISINGKVLINSDEKVETVKQIYSEYPGLYRYLSCDFQFKKDYENIIKIVEDKRKSNYPDLEANIFDNNFTIQSNNEELLKELNNSEGIAKKASEMIDELGKIVEYGESVNTRLNSGNNEELTDALPNNLLL